MLVKMRRITTEAVQCALHSTRGQSAEADFYGSRHCKFWKFPHEVKPVITDIVLALVQVIMNEYNSLSLDMVSLRMM